MRGDRGVFAARAVVSVFDRTKVGQAFGPSKKPGKTLFEDTGSAAEDRVPAITSTPLDETDFDEQDAARLLKQQMEVADLAGFGLDGKHLGHSSRRGMSKICSETQRASAGHIAEIKYFESADFMVLDATTLRNLEIFESRGEKSEKTRSLV